MDLFPIKLIIILINFILLILFLLQFIIIQISMVQLFLPFFIELNIFVHLLFSDLHTIIKNLTFNIIIY